MDSRRKATPVLYNYSYINFPYNNISDINELKYLSKLEKVILWHNKIEDISPLGNLQNLKHLDLDDNKIISIEPLKNLNQLTTLWASYNYIDNIKALENLTNLKYLYLNNNKIKDISTSEEIEIAKKLASILSVDEGSILEQKEFWLVNNNNGSNLITEEEYKLLDERKLSSSDLYDLKIERITEDMLNEEDELFRKCAKIYSLMNDGYVYSKKEILKNVSEEEYAKVIESNIPGVTGELSWERIYLYGDTLRNILGSIGSIPSEEVDEYLSSGYELTDIVGISYLEKEYEEYLKGEKAKYLVNSDNTLTLVEEEQRGNDLVLSIDIDIQMKAEEIIKDK